MMHLQSSQTSLTTAPQEEKFFGNDVIELNLKRDFDMLKTPKGQVQVQFSNPMFRGKSGMIVNYAPWCPHCHNIAPTIAELAKITRGMYPIGAINCYDEKNGNNLLADYLKISGYPTIKIWDQGNFKDYSGGRSLKDLLRHLCVENGLCDLV